MPSIVRKLITQIAVFYPNAKRWLHRFHGGVFPQYYKSLSSRQSIRESIIPERLILPLQQQVGEPAELLVKVGSKVKKNQLIARSHKDAQKALVVPVHAPTSGIIVAIEPHTLPHASGLQAMSIILKPDHKNDAIDNALQVSGKPPSSPQALKKILFNAGIVGMGGAGFPTYAKFPLEAGKVHSLLINGAECEPFITCDDQLMQTHANEIIQGALITAQALGVSQIICGIESNKPEAIRAMELAAKDTLVSIQTVETVYPMGGQEQLIQELIGLETPHSVHAIEMGVLMMNVATYAAIYRAVSFGEPLTSRLVTVSGLGLASPFNIKALFGTPFETLANAALPKTPLNYPLIMGGPMMGFRVQNNQVPVIKTTNCILANPPEATEMQMPCIRCGECMDACPINLLPQQMYWHSQAHEFEKVEKLNVFDCIECGCCSYVCPSHIPLVQYYRHAKSEIRSLHAEEKAADLARQRHEFRQERLEREKQEREARLKAKKAAVKQSSRVQTADDQAGLTTTSAPKKSAAAAAAARAAAQRAAKASSSTREAAPMPAARKKAIEAAQKASAQAAKKSSDAALKKDEKTDSKTAAKQAAMAVAKKRAQLNAAAKQTSAPITDKPTDGAPELSKKKTSIATKSSQESATRLVTETDRQDTQSKSSAAQPHDNDENPPLDKRQKAIEAAKKRAAERKAKQKEAN